MLKILDAIDALGERTIGRLSPDDRVRLVMALITISQILLVTAFLLQHRHHHR